MTITRGGATQTTDPLGQFWGYTGRFSDEETELWYYRARAYDPSRGRFLQRDPAGYSEGPSLYEYAASRPNSARDPSGLEVVYYPPGERPERRDGWQSVAIVAIVPDGDMARLSEHKGMWIVWIRDRAGPDMPPPPPEPEGIDPMPPPPPIEPRPPPDRDPFDPDDPPTTDAFRWDQYEIDMEEWVDASLTWEATHGPAWRELQEMKPTEKSEK